MGYNIERRDLLPFTLDSKLDLSALPPKVEPNKPYEIFGKSGRLYQLFAGKSSIVLNDLDTVATLSAQIENGVMSFELITRPSLDEERYNDDFDAKLFIGAAINYLEKMGNKIYIWETVWNGGTNFEQYKEYLKNTDRPIDFSWSDAVWNTWTGKQAAGHHFNRVEAKSRKDVAASKYVFHFTR